MTDLIVIEESTVLEVFSTKGGLDPHMQKVRDEIDAFVPDLSTAKGRKEIASMARKVSTSKNVMDDMGKTLVAKLKEQPKLIDAERKRMRDELDLWKIEVRKPLTDWEDKEKARIDKHELGLTSIRTFAHGYVDSLNSSVKNLDQLRESLAGLESVEMGEHWDEFEAKALLEKTKGAAKLSDLIDIEARAVAAAEEAARLQAEEEAKAQKEREKQIAAEAAKKAKAEAEAKAEQDKQKAADEAQKAADAAKEQAARDAKAIADAELAKQKAIYDAAALAKQTKEREAQAKKDAEAKAAQAAQDARDKIAADQQAEADAKEARAADKAHRTSINRAALDCLVAAGLSEDDAMEAITAIAQGLVSNVSIHY